jgi:hypothetical protein
MVNKSYILNESTSDFICRTNGDIVVNKIEKYQNVTNTKIDEVDQSKFKIPCLFKEWHHSKLRGYISDEYRKLNFNI